MVRPLDTILFFNILTSDMVLCPRKDNIYIYIILEVPNAKQTGSNSTVTGRGTPISGQML